MTQDVQPPAVPVIPPPSVGKKPVSFRRAFLAGLAALLPTALTLVILVWIVGFIHKYVAGPINEFIIWIMGLAGVDHAAETFRHREDAEGVIHGVFDFSFAGYVVAFGGVFFVGLALLTLFGRKLYRLFDRFLSRIPVLRMIYPHIKQLTEFVFSEDKVSAFRRVVMLQYPRKGVWSLGFVTGPAMGVLRERTGLDLVSVFVPSSPTPFTGYVVSVPRDEVVDLPITVDEALRFTISGGVLMPPGQVPTPGQGKDPDRSAEAPPGDRPATEH